MADADMILQALVVAGSALTAAEGAFFHGRRNFDHPAMWLPPAYGLLVLGLGIPFLLDPADPMRRFSFYFLLWVGLAVGAAGLISHLLHDLRSLRGNTRNRYRRLAVGPPPLTPLSLAVLAAIGLASFS